MLLGGSRGFHEDLRVVQCRLSRFHRTFRGLLGWFIASQEVQEVFNEIVEDFSNVSELLRAFSGT